MEHWVLIIAARFIKQQQAGSHLEQVVATWCAAQGATFRYVNILPNCTMFAVSRPIIKMQQTSVTIENNGAEVLDLTGT